MNMEQLQIELLRISEVRVKDSECVDSLSLPPISKIAASQMTFPIRTTDDGYNITGSNIAVDGDRIDVQNQSTNAEDTDVLSLISNKMENTTRHLKGNYLVCWEHENDIMFNFKQILLYSFNDHLNSITCLYVLDYENSFMSGSRDKTVKLWSLRSMRWHSLHLGFVHGCPHWSFKIAKVSSNLLFYELRVNYIKPGWSYSIVAISSSGMWLGTGKSYGHIAVLDTKTGLTISTWRAHDSEALELLVYGENTLISSSLVQVIRAWNVQDGRLKLHEATNNLTFVWMRWYRFVNHSAL
ncbi:hypothetical protein FQR65_LT14251 [Abscondita terminalis]|nr:hypothetical protein FQR65_LT14251 [Abscondita terminalis]